MLPRTIARRSLLATTRRVGRGAWAATAAGSGSLLDSRALSTTAARRRPALPEAKAIDVGGAYSIKYIDLKPLAPVATESTTPTIVLIHGAPGSHQDFKYLIPLLQDKAHIVAINLPGNGGSAVLDETSNYYEHIRAANLGRVAHDALVEICGGDENVFVVGHSFGGHATINVAALNEMERAADRKLRIRGIALLASAGLRVHKGIEKSHLHVFHGLLASEYALVEAVGRAATRALYTRLWKFPSSLPTEEYVAGLVRCASTDFSAVSDHAARIAHVPAFLAWAKDEPFIQGEIFRELSDACAPGPRFVFETGGHNIQKTKAEFLAAELLEWTQRVVTGDIATANATRQIDELP